METAEELDFDESLIVIEDETIDKLREIAGDGCVLCEMEPEEDD